MAQTNFQTKLNTLMAKHDKLVQRKNISLESENGIYHRYKYPVITAAHIPIFWRYDLNPETNPSDILIFKPTQRPMDSQDVCLFV